MFRASYTVPVPVQYRYGKIHTWYFHIVLYLFTVILQITGILHFFYLLQFSPIGVTYWAVESTYLHQKLSAYLISSYQAGEASSGPGENQGEVNSTSVMVITAPEAVYLSKILFFRFLAIHQYYSLCFLCPSIFSHFAYIYLFTFNFSLIFSLSSFSLKYPFLFFFLRLSHLFPSDGIGWVLFPHHP